ncbi:MAG: transport system ATP-binding/permease protein, partial [Actinomycetota bacterium]|nr:transport system ATP-binding/permease protein [Actinomycetota bacterium]
DLDIDTLTALEDLLDDWPGTLLVVSHDRYFIERVTDRSVALLGDGQLRFLVGGVDEYLSLRDAATSAAAASARAGTSGGGDVVPPSDAAAARADRKELARVERVLDKLRTREARLHDELAAAATDHERVLALDVELRALLDERTALEDRWLELADRVG